MTTIAKLDVDALRRAHEEHDPELLASLYADGGGKACKRAGHGRSNGLGLDAGARDSRGARTLWKELCGAGLTLSRGEKLFRPPYRERLSGPAPPI